MTTSRTVSPAEKKYENAHGEIGRLFQEAKSVLGAEVASGETGTVLRDVGKKLELARTKWQDECFQIAVLALVKSGKSTLINAWLGNEFLASCNTPESARIVRVQHARVDPPVLKENTSAEAIILARGSEAIRNKIKALNKAVRDSRELPPEDELILEAPLICLADRELGKHRFHILDTPGPNEAGGEFLRTKVGLLLDEADVIVYLLDYTKLKTAEEKLMFQQLGQMRPELMKAYARRLFLVVNKIDAENRNSLTPEQTAAYVVNILRQQIPALEITPERVLLVAAESALLARVVESGKASDAQVRDFAKKCFGEINARKTTLKQCQEHAEAFLEESKLRVLEGQVISFVYADRGRLLLEGLLDDLDRSLIPLVNYFEATRSALQLEQEQLVGKLEQLKQDMQEVHQARAGTASAAETVQRQIEDWVKEEFRRFHDDIKSKLSADLGESKAPGTRFGAVVNLVRGSRLYQFVFGIRNKQFSTQKEAEENLAELNRQINQQLQDWYEQFRLDLEHSAVDRQRQLYTSLSQEMEPLVRKIEQRVNQRLNISLTPRRVEVPLPTVTDLHQEFEARIKQYLKKQAQPRTYTEHQKQGAGYEAYIEGYDEHGWTFKSRTPRWGMREKYITVPVEKSYTEQRYRLDLESLRAAWEECIRRMTTASIATVRRVVADSVREEVDRVQQEVQAYADEYIDAVQKALNERRKGKEAGQMRLKEVTDRLKQLQSVLDSRRRIKKYLAQEDDR